MTTSPFERVSLAPATPAWIVRQIMRADVDTIEIVFVGHSNRMKIDSAVEKLARHPWHADPEEPFALTVLADSRAEMIGIRLVGCMASSSQIREVLVDMFDKQIVCQAFRADVARALTKNLPGK